MNKKSAKKVLEALCEHMIDNKPDGYSSDKAVEFLLDMIQPLYRSDIECERCDRGYADWVLDEGLKEITPKYKPQKVCRYCYIEYAIRWIHIEREAGIPKE